MVFNSLLETTINCMIQNNILIFNRFTKHTSTYAVKPLCVYFDSIVDTQFKVLFEVYYIMILSFLQNTSYIHYFCTVSSNITNDYSSTNLVIDGEKLHLTPLQVFATFPFL